MGRYRPGIIDGVAGFSLRGRSRAIDAPHSPGNGAGQQGGGAPIINEPEPATATIDDWVAYRQQILPLVDRDPSMRVALAVAEAQIAKLRERMGAGGKAVTKATDGGDDPA